MTVENETITPKANRRVVDAQLVDEPQGAAHFGARDSAKAPEFSDVKTGRSGLPRKLLDALLLVKSLVLIALVAHLWVQQQAHNQDTAQLGQLQEQMAQLSAEQARLKATAEALDNKPLVSQADVEGLKQGLTTLESQVIDITGVVQNQVKTLLQQAQKRFDDWINHPANQTQAPAVNSAEDAAPASSFQQDIQQIQERFKGMSEQVQELFQFKESQLSKPEPEPILTKPVQHLSEMQMQQWILEANTHWLLEGNVAKTQQQLQAIEQAVGLSEFAQQALLMRLIGEDMAMLKAMEQQKEAKALPNSALLKEWLLQQVNQKSTPVQSQASSVITEEAEPASVWQRLQGGFSTVFSVTKRDSEQTLSRVEQTLMQEVILQRGYLWIEQLDWSMQLASVTQREQALVQFKAFVTEHWPHANSAELQRLLQPYADFAFVTPQPLNVVNAL